MCHTALVSTVVTDAQAMAERSAADMYAADQASQRLGITISAVSPGHAEATMLVSATMINGHDIGHGGYVFLLADTAFAFACNSYGRTTVASSASITFLAPVRQGDRLVAVAQERHRAGRGGIYDVTVRRLGVPPEGDGIVAEFRGHSRELRAHDRDSR